MEDVTGDAHRRWNPRDRAWMEIALAQARRAQARDEVPIGAVLVVGEQALASAHNLTRVRCDPTAHAELLALRTAARRSGYQRLDASTLYSTVEPCCMCAGALIHARVSRVVWAVRDPKFGGCVSLAHLLDLPGANHRAEWSEGLLADESRSLLQDFFRSKRTKKGRPNQNHRCDP